MSRAAMIAMSARRSAASDQREALLADYESSSNIVGSPPLVFNFFVPGKSAELIALMTEHGPMAKAAVSQ